MLEGSYDRVVQKRTYTQLVQIGFGSEPSRQGKGARLQGRASRRFGSGGPGEIEKSSQKRKKKKVMHLFFFGLFKNA